MDGAVGLFETKKIESGEHWGDIVLFKDAAANTNGVIATDFAPLNDDYFAFTKRIDAAPMLSCLHFHEKIPKQQMHLILNGKLNVKCTLLERPLATRSQTAS